MTPGLVSRELPFTARKAIHDLSPEAGRLFPAEGLLMQGMIDCVVDEGDRALLIDYKTDYVAGEEDLELLTERYRVQIDLYRRALGGIWRLREVRAALVFLAARRVVWLKEDGE